MRHLLTGFAAILFLIGLGGVSEAQLTTIGTAQFGGTGTEYNLIWDDDNNGNSVVWLDYTNGSLTGKKQNVWAAELGLSLSYKVDPTYTITWDDAAWRLPSTVDGLYVRGDDGTTTGGWNVTSSEMGHLYYEELRNLAGMGGPQSEGGLKYTGDFENLNGLSGSWYASGTEYALTPGYGWAFYMVSGFQSVHSFANGGYYGLAVRSGQVSTTPIPAAAWLLGSGLVGLAGVRRKLNK